MIVRMGVVVNFAGRADFQPGLFQNRVGGNHVRRGRFEQHGQSFRAFQSRRCGPLPELGFMPAVMFDPMRQQNP